MPKLPNGLTPVQQAFVSAYIQTGFNATRAYLKIKPQVSYETALAHGSELVRNSAVAEALAERLEKQHEKSIASREFLTTEAHEIGTEAREKGQLGTALSAVELKGKLNRVFTEDVPEMEGYKVLMQQLIVQVAAPIAALASAPTDVDGVDSQAEESGIDEGKQ